MPTNRIVAFISVGVDTRPRLGNFQKYFAELEKQNFNGYIYIERDSVEPGGNLASVKQEIKYYNDQVNKLK